MVSKTIKPSPEKSKTNADFLKAALGLAAKGWRVFPVKPKQKKPPLIKDWQMLATTNPEQIQIWWKQWPDANVGIATGKGSNLLVLDIDPRHGGDDSLAELEKQYGELASSIEVITGTGGTHKYFSFPVDDEIRNSAGALRDGLDIRGEGGYVVAPPSIHPDTGRTYEWEVDHHPEETPLATMDEWMLRLLILLEEQRPTSTLAGSNSDIPNGKIPEGRRNSYLTSCAGSMRWRGMDLAAIEAALLVENQLKWGC